MGRNLHISWYVFMSVSIAKGYGLEARGSVLGRARDFHLFHNAQPDSEAHPGPYIMGTGGWFPGGKMTGGWNWPLTSNKCWSQEWWICTSTAPHVFMVQCLINAVQGQLYLYLTLHLHVSVHVHFVRERVTEILGEGRWIWTSKRILKHWFNWTKLHKLRGF